VGEAQPSKPPPAASLALHTPTAMTGTAKVSDDSSNTLTAGLSAVVRPSTRPR